MVKITDSSRAVVRTSMGNLTFAFIADKAPRTVENFVKLAHKGFYDGLTFHRVLKDFMIQGGCPKGDGSGGPGYTIRPEFNDTPHVKGVVSMARSNDPHSAGSQFFIMHGDARYLDSRYTAFATVEDSDLILDKIADVPTNMELRFNETSIPRDPIYINGIDLSDVEFDEDEGAQGKPEAKSEDSTEDSSDDKPKSARGRGRGRARGGRGTSESNESGDSQESDSKTESDVEPKAEGETEVESKPAPRRRSARAKPKADEAGESKPADGEAEASTEEKPKIKRAGTRKKAVRKAAAKPRVTKKKADEKKSED